MARVIERGWVGHYICSHRCMFKRNTLIVGDKDSVVVSTVGGMRPTDGRNGLETIGHKRYYETMVFGAKNASSPVSFNFCCPYCVPITPSHAPSGLCTNSKRPS